MIYDIMSEACDDLSVESFYLAVSLWMKGGCGQVLNSKGPSDDCKEIQYKLQSVFGQWVCFYTVWDDSVADKQLHHSSMLL